MIMQIALLIVWIIFFLIFSGMGFWHFSQANRNIPNVKMKKRSMQQDNSKVKVEISFAGSDIDQPLSDFINDFNKYIDIQNVSSYKAHILTAFGYWIAAATSVFSGMIQIFI